MFDPITNWIQSNVGSLQMVLSIIWGLLCLVFIFVTGSKSMKAFSAKNMKDGGIWLAMAAIILIFGVAGIAGIIALLKNFSPSGIDRQGMFAMGAGDPTVLGYANTALTAKGLL